MMMRKSTATLLLAFVVAGCSKDNAGIRVTNDAPPQAVVANKARHEPVFYNGKTYQLEFAPVEGGNFAMAVKGMSGKQQKDAVAVATSSLRYFKCPDGQNGVLTDSPRYLEGQWRMTARCG